MRKRETKNLKREPANSPAPRSALRTPCLIARALLDWFAVNARDLPWRRTRDPYAIWASEIMLQQTQVKTVIPYWERWMRELPTLQSLAEAKPDTIHKLWEGLGYYTRVRNLQKAAQQICANHGGVFPREFDAILALPGIGRYTAGAIASIAFNQPAPILDGNVIRVLCRLHGIAENPQEKRTNARLWQLAGELASAAATLTQHALRKTTGEITRQNKPKMNKGSDLPTALPCSALNQSLMELGALICTPRTPSCGVCPVAKHCVARRENRVDALPRPKQRAAVTERGFMVFLVEQRGRFLVQQRGANVVNAHLWEFPNLEANGKADVVELAQLEFGAKPTATQPLCTIKHAITRYRITAEAYRVEFGAQRIEGGKNRRWCRHDELARLAFTSAHRRIADKLRGQPCG